MLVDGVSSEILRVEIDAYGHDLDVGDEHLGTRVRVVEFIDLLGVLGS